MIAVVVILGILAAVAVPKLTNLGSTRSGMAGKQMLRDLTFARQRAVATGTVTWVVFNTGAGTWSVKSENPASPGIAGATIITDTATGQPYTSTLGVNNYAGVSMTSCNFGGGSQIGFDWLGKPRINDSTALASQGSVVLSSGNSVTVQPTTGYIRYVP